MTIRILRLLQTPNPRPAVYIMHKSHSFLPTSSVVWAQVGFRTLKFFLPMLEFEFLECMPASNKKIMSQFFGKN